MRYGHNLLRPCSTLPNDPLSLRALHGVLSLDR